MDLPQTLAGVPAPGIDPTIEELSAITTLDNIFEWLGTLSAVRAVLVASLGAGTPKLRDVAYIKAKDYDDSVAQITVTIDGATRGLFPI